MQSSMIYIVIMAIAFVAFVCLLTLLIVTRKKEKDVYVDGEFFLHVMPVWAFCPVLTTGEDVRNEETYCEHMGQSSWAQSSWKSRILQKMSPAFRTRLIKFKRRLLG